MISQPIIAPHTPAAMSLVVTVNAGPAAEAAVRGLCGDLAGLVRAIGFRDLDGHLSCVMGFGSDAWDRLFGAPRPQGVASIQGIPRPASGHRHAGRHPFSCPRREHGSLLRTGGPDHVAARRRRLDGRRSARLPVLRRSRPARFRRWHGESRGQGGRRRRRHRRGGCGLRRRQLRDRAEVPP